MTPEAVHILFVGLGIVAAVLAAFVAVRYDQRLARRQAAADHLIDWAYETGALAADAIHAALAYYDRGEWTEVPWGESERRARLTFERYELRLPGRLREEIAEDARDLLAVTAVALASFPRKALESVVFTTEPPADFLQKGTGAPHGEWLDGLVSGVIEPLEPYAATGRLPKRRR